MAVAHPNWSKQGSVSPYLYMSLDGGCTYKLQRISSPHLHCSLQLTAQAMASKPIHHHTKTSNHEEEDADCMFAMQLASASVVPMALKAAIELDLLDIMARAGPGPHLSTTQIASQLPTQNPDAPTMLDRILRLLASYSILTCSVVTGEDGRIERLYGLTPVCKFLTKNGDGFSIAPLLVMNHDKVFMETWYDSTCLIYIHA